MELFRELTHNNRILTQDGIDLGCFTFEQRKEFSSLIEGFTSLTLVILEAEKLLKGFSVFISYHFYYIIKIGVFSELAKYI